MESIQQIGAEVELYISAQHLKNLDLLSKSDPMCRILIRTDTKSAWSKLGETEVIKDNLNPVFKTNFKIFYQFESHQYLRFEMLDEDSPGKYESLGECEASVGQIAGSQGFKLEIPLLKGGTDTKSVLIAQVIPLKVSSWDVNLRLSAINLPGHTTCLCMSEKRHQLEIQRIENIGGTNRFLTQYVSEITRSDTTTTGFIPISIKGQKLCNSDKNKPLLFKFNNNIDGTSHVIGETVASVQQLQDVNCHDIKDRHHRVLGQLMINHIQVKEKPTFIQYLQSGWGINLSIAIDYTGSNGNPSWPSSLHYLGDQNQYEMAITQVGSILECYDTDRMFPVFGFGGIPKFMGQNLVNHCFPLNGIYENPFVFSTAGILQLYRQNLPGIELSGPTYFSHILNQITAIVKSRENEQIYNVLLILTDGEIHDMQQTKQILVEASKTPLSVIIIGVGNENFTMMRELDADERILQDNFGQRAVRDIVQFVRFRDHAKNYPGLASEVLKELPEQFVNYMLYKNIMPNGFIPSV
ncbi:UNKNOWN [Stylonychia lemnae]|uniref:Copine family protein n=1 Tax=Stylonychia lemnae TaxID=5949 RepID=A0A078AC19_STYLE|nr:UNKNOWN [Stylonychia lemnae]|eukprot:CDW79754.1 UNKNOWN [Stylonychia lemnae]